MKLRHVCVSELHTAAAPSSSSVLLNSATIRRPTLHGREPAHGLASQSPMFSNSRLSMPGVSHRHPYGPVSIRPISKSGYNAQHLRPLPRKALLSPSTVMGSSSIPLSGCRWAVCERERRGLWSSFRPFFGFCSLRARPHPGRE